MSQATKQEANDDEEAYNAALKMLRNNYGARCIDHLPGCSSCDAYGALDAMFDNFHDANQYAVNSVEFDTDGWESSREAEFKRLISTLTIQDVNEAGQKVTSMAFATSHFEKTDDGEGMVESKFVRVVFSHLEVNRNYHLRCKVTSLYHALRPINVAAPADWTPWKEVAQARGLKPN